MESEVSLLESRATTLESVSPPRDIEKEHLDLIGFFKELAEGKRNLNQYIKSNAGIISYWRIKL